MVYLRKRIIKIRRIKKRIRKIIKRIIGIRKSIKRIIEVTRIRKIKGIIKGTRTEGKKWLTKKKLKYREKKIYKGY